MSFSRTIEDRLQIAVSLVQEELFFFKERITATIDFFPSHVSMTRQGLLCPLPQPHVNGNHAASDKCHRNARMLACDQLLVILLSPTFGFSLSSDHQELTTTVSIRELFMK